MRAAAAAKPTWRGSQQHWPALHAGKESGDETESRGCVVDRLGRDLVQGAEGKATLRETAVEGGNTER